MKRIVKSNTYLVSIFVFFLCSLSLMSQRVSVNDIDVKWDDEKNDIIVIKESEKAVNGILYCDFGELGEYKNGFPMGSQKRWWSNGQQQWECNKNGKFYSKYYSRIKDGNTQLLIDNKEDGNYSSWYSDGQLEEVQNTDSIIKYYKNGSLKETIDRVNRECKLYSPTKNLICKVDSNRHWIYYHENGGKSQEGTLQSYYGYPDSTKHEWKFYNLTGKLMLSETRKGSKLIDYQFYDEKESAMLINNLQEGSDYRVIEFTKELPVKFPDVEVIKENVFDYDEGYVYGDIIIKLKQKIKFLKIDYLDDGCNEPYAEFIFKGKVGKVLDTRVNEYLYKSSIVFSDELILSKTKQIEINQCEGGTKRITIVYE